MPLQRIYRDISVKDSVHLDSFSKLRISEPSNYDFFDFTYANSNSWGNNIFSSPYAGLNFFQHYSGTDIVGTFASSTGIKFINNSLQFKSAAALTNTIPSFASIQTRRLINITRNSTIKAYISFNLLNTPVFGRNMWIGIGNDNAVNNEDGKSGFIGLKQEFLAITATNPLGIRVGLTLTTLGSVSSTFINKDDWEDRFDGTGPSGVTLDFTKIQVLSIEYRSGGHGEVEWGFMVGGKFCRAAAIYNVNKFVTDSFGYVQIAGTNATLRPILNSCRLTAGYTRTGGSNLIASQVHFELYGGVIFRESDPTELETRNNYSFSRSFTISAVLSSGVSTMVLRLRKKLTFNAAISTYLTSATIDSIQFISTASVPLYWELVYNNLGSGVYTSLDSNSLIEFNTTSVARPSGPTVCGGFIAAGETLSFKVPKSVKNMWQLVNGVVGSGGTDDYIYFGICITPIGGGTTANQIRVAITTEESYN